MRFHLEMKAEENLAAGISPKEARDAARRQFGNQTLLREVSRDMTGAEARKSEVPFLLDASMQPITAVNAWLQEVAQDGATSSPVHGRPMPITCLITSAIWKRIISTGDR